MDALGKEQDSEPVSSGDESGGYATDASCDDEHARRLPRLTRKSKAAGHCEDEGVAVDEHSASGEAATLEDMTEKFWKHFEGKVS